MEWLTATLLIGLIILLCTGFAILFFLYPARTLLAILLAPLVLLLLPLLFILGLLALPFLLLLLLPLLLILWVASRLVA